MRPRVCALAPLTSSMSPWRRLFARSRDRESMHRMAIPSPCDLRPATGSPAVTPVIPNYVCHRHTLKDFGKKKKKKKRKKKEKPICG
jgi:hypothetical protein